MKLSNLNPRHATEAALGLRHTRRSAGRGIRVIGGAVEAYPTLDLEFVGAQVIDMDGELTRVIIGGGVVVPGDDDDPGGGGPGGGIGDENGSSGTPVLMLNNSGEVMLTGAVVVVDETADRAVTTTTDEASILIAGVVQAPIPADTIGPVLFNGYAAAVITSGDRGEYVQTSATAGEGQATADREAGSFAVILAGPGITDITTDIETTELDTAGTSLTITVPTVIPGRQLFLALFLDVSSSAATVSGWTAIGATTDYWYFRRLSTGVDTATASWTGSSPSAAVVLALKDGIDLADPVETFAFDSTTAAAAVSGMDASRPRYAIAAVRDIVATPADWTDIASVLAESSGGVGLSDLAAGITPTNDPGNTQNWSNLVNVTDGNAATAALVGSEYLGGSPWTDLFVIDLGGTFTVSSFYVAAADGNLDRFTDYQYWNGAAWVTPPGTWVPAPGGTWTYNFTTNTSTTKMRFGYTGAATLHGTITVQTVSIYGVGDKIAAGSIVGQYIGRDAAVTSPYTGAAAQNDAIFAINLTTEPLSSALLYGPDLADGAGASGGALVNDTVRSVSDISTASTSLTDLTGFSITLTTGARRCLVTFHAGAPWNSTTDTESYALSIDGSSVGILAVVSTGYSGSGISSNGFTYLTDVLSAGAHTFKVRWKVGSGTGHTDGTIAATTFSVMEQPA